MPASKRKKRRVTVFEVSKKIRLLRREVQKQAARMDRYGELWTVTADRVAHGLQGLEDLIGGYSADAFFDAPIGGGARSEAQAARRAEAERGVARVEVVRRVDGSADVSIDGRKPFRLPPQLATLLALLAATDACAEDGLSDWKPKTMLALELGKTSKSEISTARITKLVHNLRNAFTRAGENRFLIQSDRRGGVRFAVRVKPTPPMIAEHPEGASGGDNDHGRGVL